MRHSSYFASACRAREGGQIKASGPRFFARGVDLRSTAKRIFGSALAVAGVLLVSAARGAAVPQAQAANPAYWDWQPRPAMGWNSWDCYGAGVNEEQALANADYMAKNLKAHGYTLVTIDIQWYAGQRRIRKLTARRGRRWRRTRTGGCCRPGIGFLRPRRCGRSSRLPTSCTHRDCSLGYI